jgi:hypothetical protein
MGTDGQKVKTWKKTIIQTVSTLSPVMLTPPRAGSPPIQLHGLWCRNGLF